MKELLDVKYNVALVLALDMAVIVESCPESSFFIFLFYFSQLDAIMCDSYDKCL